MSDLAAALAVPLSTATRIVDHLVEKRLVERKRSPQDRRVVTIHFSRRGRTIHQYVFSARTSLAAQLLSALAPAHRAALLKHLRALHSCGSK
jgi:DNA-binding MarR family transcriptional regulator